MSATTVYNMVVPRSAADVPRLYVEARIAGLEVTHYTTKSCVTFDGSPRPGCALGVFRTVGSLIWWKGERRWEVRARMDAGPVELATLLMCGLHYARTYGRTPGHLTRRRVFRHMASSRNGKPIAFAEVAFALEADDLLRTTAAEEALPQDLDLETLLSS